MRCSCFVVGKRNIYFRTLAVRLRSKIKKPPMAGFLFFSAAHFLGIKQQPHKTCLNNQLKFLTTSFFNKISDFFVVKLFLEANFNPVCWRAFKITQSCAV